MHMTDTRTEERLSGPYPGAGSLRELPSSWLIYAIRTADYRHIYNTCACARWESVVQQETASLRSGGEAKLPIMGGGGVISLHTFKPFMTSVTEYHLVSRLIKMILNFSINILHASIIFNFGALKIRRRLTPGGVCGEEMALTKDLTANEGNSKPFQPQTYQFIICLQCPQLA
jgi:hypothetical protein